MTASRSSGAADLLRYPFLAVVFVVMTYPIFWMVGGSFKPSQEIFTNPAPFTGNPTITNYVEGWAGAGVPFWVFLVNSAIVCSLAVLGNLFACTLSAYAFARYEFWGKRIFFALVLLTVMLPRHVRLISEYVGFSTLGLVDTFVPLLLPHFLAVDGFFVFLMVQFIRGMPRELDEAARIDGCSEFGIFWRIILPLLGPALMTMAILTLVQVYQDFFTQLIYLNSPTKYTVPLGLRQFIDSTSASSYGAVLAMSTVSLAPVAIIFFVFQRHVITGIATTGLKD